MSQAQWIILVYKITLSAGVVLGIGFIVQYSRFARWRSNPVGRAVVEFDALVVLALIPSLLSLFLKFNRLTSMVAAWFDAGIFALIAVSLLRRIILWQRLHNVRPEETEPEEEVTLCSP